MTGVFLFSGRSSTPPAWPELLVRALIGALLSLLAQGLIHQYLELRRESPTLQIDGSQRLTQLVNWIRTKDASRGSYPGDHGLVLFSLTLYGWRFLQPWARWAGAGGAVLFTLPRLMSGAHWLTDILCGSIPGGLIAVGLYVGLGLAGLIDRRIVPVLGEWIRGLTPARVRRWLDHPAQRQSRAA